VPQPDAAQLEWLTSQSCNGGACVQVAVALAGDAVAVRDSKDSDGAILLYTAGEWRDFIAGAKNGEFDIV
jgi:hypothetical protein